MTHGDEAAARMTNTAAPSHRRRQLMGASLAGVGSLVFDLAASGQAQAQQPGVLRVAINLNPSTLDPATGRSGGDHQFLYPLYDTLVQWNPRTLEPQPGLALSWTYKDDNTLVLVLRPSVIFHDGTPCDAEAVKFNLDRARLDPKSNIKVDLSTLESVEASGVLTVTIKLKTPDRSLPQIFSDRAGMMASPTAIKAGGGSIDRAPVGAGPWKFIKWEDGSIVSYEAFANHWNKGLPKTDRLDMRVITDTSSGVRSVLAGENDLVVAVPPVQKASLERSGKVKVFATPSLYLHMIYLDYSRPPFNDIRVRRAFNLAIDRVAYNKATMAGLGEPATTLFPKSYWPHDPSLTGILAYDPDKARALLKQAGTPEINFTGIAYSDQAATQRVEVLLEMWRKVGFKAKMRSGAVAAASDAFFFQRQVDVFLAAITPRPDPSMVPGTLFGKTSPYNGGHLEIAGMEAALTASRSGTTQAERKLALSKVQRIAIEEAVFVPLLFDVSVIAVGKKFTGFEPNLLGRPRFEQMAAIGK